MKHIISPLILCLLALMASSALGQRRLVWSDEFDQNGLPDTTRWRYDVGDGCPNICGWGNNELEYYTLRRAENVWIENGVLNITARREAMGGRDYTSARMVSRASWRYGRVEVRAKLPQGLGTWPAIWMLSADWKYGGWPQSGEIDIMEHVGYNKDKIFGTVHTMSYNHVNGTQRGDSTANKTVERKFHVYAIDWTEDSIVFSMDNNPYFTFPHMEKTSDAWPFDQPFVLLMNVAVGGNWGGKHGVDPAIFPQSMEVDYVRIYGESETKK